MANMFAIRFAAALVLSLPATVSASSVVLFPHTPGDTAGFKPVSATAAGNGSGGYWDNKSYDSWRQGVGSACSAAAIASGGACDWKGFPAPSNGQPYQNLTSPRTSTPNGLTYYGMTNPAPTDAEGRLLDTPLDFFFTGPFSFDFEVLFQLSAWDSTVEFGTYEAGNPDNRTPVLPHAGGAAGPYSSNSGAIETSGSAHPAGDFGFYYRNSRYGGAADTEILFFTESRFNRIGHYFGYLSDPHSGLWQQTPTRFGGDDEHDEARFVDFANSINRQQFALFHEGGRYWLGLEDQMGDVTSAFCWDRSRQPCSDYDHNDLIISFTERSVPEPMTLSLLASGCLAAAALRRRRRQRR